MNSILLSGRVKKTPSFLVDPSRYEFISLDQAEPDLGIPAKTNSVLVSSTVGSRSWTSNLSVDSLQLSDSLGLAGYTITTFQDLTSKITTAEDSSTNLLYPVLVSNSGQDYDAKISKNSISINAKTGEITHGGLVPSYGTNIDQLKIFTVSLTLETDWMETGIYGDSLASGSYFVQLYANDSFSGGNNTNEYYTGVMSWYSGQTDSSLELPTDEIVLHRAGAGSEAGMYLRTFRSDASDSRGLRLQIYSNLPNASASNYVFKFRKII